VPTSAQFTTLQTYLGGAAVAGGKMKMTGLDYWNTLNTGADNSSGFTALGAGRRSGIDGTFSLINSTSYIWSSSLSAYVYIQSSSNALGIGGLDLRYGGSLRLIKSA